MDTLAEELNSGSSLALALVDHLANMGGAANCVIPVVDRAEEYVVVVMLRANYDARTWPIT